jgi:glycosyltransferase involved in cell wall biosynthesis
VTATAVDQPVRVLQLIDSLARAGAEQSLATLAPHLVDEGIDLHVAYLKERDGLRPDIERAGVPVTSLAGGREGRRAWAARTTDLIRELQPTVVHTTLFEADLAGRRAAARVGVATVSSFVNTAYGRIEIEHDGPHPLKLRAAQLADAITARKVARFHAVTGHVASVMSRRLRVPMDRIEVIPRGRDAAALGRRSPARRADVRRRLDIPPESPVVVAVGRHEAQKGLDVLLDAVPAVRSQLPDLQVLIAGRQGRATAALRERVRTADLDGAVSFLGMRDDVPDLLAATDVLAFPSRWEGAGGTLIEAMALECPIVSSRLPTLLETVDESTAVLVEPGRADDLSRGLLQVLRNRERAFERTRTARARFEQGYTIHASAERMAQLYANVAGCRPTAPGPRSAKHRPSRDWSRTA